MDTIKEKLIENCELLFNNEDYKNQYGISPLMIFKNLKLIQEDKSNDFSIFTSIKCGWRFSVEYIITSVTVFQDKFRTISYGFLVF